MFSQPHLLPFSCANAKFQVHQNILSVASPRACSISRRARYWRWNSPWFKLKAQAFSNPSFLSYTPPLLEQLLISKRPVSEAARKLELFSIEHDLRGHLRVLLANDSNLSRSWASAIRSEEENARQACEVLQHPKIIPYYFNGG